MSAFFLIATLLMLVRYQFRILSKTTYVTDGDSIIVRGLDWRLKGYDAPEWDQPGGQEASLHLHKILGEGYSLAIVRGCDLYNRPLATVLTLRGPLSWRMSLAGHGHGEGFVAGFLTFIARILRRGLWGRPGGGILPRLWRAGR